MPEEQSVVVDQEEGSVGALVVGVGGWAATTELSSAIVASGTVVVENNVKKIQHLTGGIVGKVTKVVDDVEVELQIAEGVKVRAVRSLIAEVRAKGEPVAGETP